MQKVTKKTRRAVHSVNRKSFFMWVCVCVCSVDGPRDVQNSICSMVAWNQLTTDLRPNTQRSNSALWISAQHKHWLQHYIRKSENNMFHSMGAVTDTVDKVSWVVGHSNHLQKFFENECRRERKEILFSELHFVLWNESSRLCLAILSCSNSVCRPFFSSNSWLGQHFFALNLGIEKRKLLKFASVSVALQLKREIAVISFEKYLLTELRTDLS